LNDDGVLSDGVVSYTVLLIGDGDGIFVGNVDGTEVGDNEEKILEGDNELEGDNKE
jgi:hypothetical protein